MSSVVVGNQSDIVSLLSQGASVFYVSVNKQPNPLSKPVAWSVDDTAVKLVKAGVPKDDARILQKQDVDGEALPYLTDDSLSKMGIPTFGRRVKVLRAAQTLLLAEAEKNAPPSDQPSRNLLDPAPLSQSSINPSRSTSSLSSTQPIRSSRAGDDLEEDFNNRRGLSSTPQATTFAPAPSPQRRSEPSVSSSSSAAANDGDDDDGYDSDEPREPEPAPSKAIVPKKQAVSGDGGDDLFSMEEGSEAVSFMAVKPWLGAIVAPSRPPKFEPSPPSTQLRLEWVHGYRSFDSRTNLVYNSQGDIVYPVAGVCVVYKTKTKSQKHFFGHDDDVRCLAQHPINKNLMASGQNATIIKGKGDPPKICVWDSSSSDLSRSYVMKMTQADRAVRSVCFTGDGKYLASVSNDDQHTVKIWDWEKRTLIASAKGDTSPIFLIRGNPKDPNELVTVGKRHSMFWTFDGTKLTGRRGQIGANKQVTFYSVAFSEKGYACLGAEDGGVYVFVGGKAAKVFANIHKGKVLTIDSWPGGLVSGGGDGKVHVLDKKMDIAKSFQFSNKVTSAYISGDNLLVGTQSSEVFEIKDFQDTDVEDDEKLDAITRGHSDGELWALAVAPDGKHFVTAGEDNTICLWDITTHRMLKRGIISDKKGKAPLIKKASTTSTHPTNQCARAIAISPNGKQIVIGQNNGECSIYDTRTMSRITTVDLNKFGKRQVTDQVGNWIQTIQFSPSGHAVAIGTHGSVVVLLDVLDNYKPKGVLKSSASFISHLDWNADGTCIQTNDGGYELLFYHVDDQDLSQVSQITNATSMKDTKWYTQTCVLGWPVQGIFDPSQGGQDVNSVDASPSRTLLVSGDDNGNVNLYRYPALKTAQPASFHAHSSHVVTTRFTADEKYVLSTGGHDLSIMQWAVVPK